MKTKPIQIIVLEPDDGMTLTNGETYSKKVYLGKNDSPDHWQEIPDREVPEEWWDVLGIHFDDEDEPEPATEG